MFKNLLVVTAAIGLVILPLKLHAAILVEENNQSIKNEYVSDQNNQPNARTSYQSSNLIYQSAQDLRKNSKIGIGTEIGSTLGGIGLELQLNFDPDNSLLMGIGNGSGFKSFHFGYKYSLGGQWFHPYMSTVFTHWYASDKSNVSSALVDSIYGKDNKDDLSATLVAPKIGLQYNQLKGDLTGLSIYGELAWLLDISSFKNALTGGAGVIYFF